MSGRNPAFGLRRVAFILLLPMTLGGCGFMFVHGPPAGHQEMQSFNCTQGNAGPIADVALAGLGMPDSHRVG